MLDPLRPSGGARGTGMPGIGNHWLKTGKGSLQRMPRARWPGLDARRPPNVSATSSIESLTDNSSEPPRASTCAWSSNSPQLPGSQGQDRPGLGGLGVLAGPGGCGDLAGCAAPGASDGPGALVEPAAGVRWDPGVGRVSGVPCASSPFCPGWGPMGPCPVPGDGAGVVSGVVGLPGAQPGTSLGRSSCRPGDSSGPDPAGDSSDAPGPGLGASTGGGVRSGGLPSGRRGRVGRSPGASTAGGVRRGPGPG